MIALVRTEMTKAVRRMRTLVIALGLVGLPTLIVVAIHAHGHRPEHDEGAGCSGSRSRAACWFRPRS